MRRVDERFIRWWRPRCVENGGESSEKRGIVEVSFGGHDPVRACLCEAAFDVGEIEDVAVGEDGHFDCFFDGADLGPVGEALGG